MNLSLLSILSTHAGGSQPVLLDREGDVFGDMRAILERHDIRSSFRESVNPDTHIDPAPVSSSNMSLEEANAKNLAK